MWPAKFLHTTQLATDIWEFSFSRPANYTYLPGQYASVSLEEPIQDPRGRARTMSLTSHPDDDYLAFVTKIFEKPSPFKTKLMQMQPGDSILVGAALGDLVLPLSS